MPIREDKLSHSPIAIIGMGCMFPGARNLREFWRLLRRGDDGITDVPPTHWPVDQYVSADPQAVDQTCCGRGGFLSPVPFDPTEFGIPPAILEATDTSQLLGLVVAKEALDDAGYGETREFNRERVSVILGVTGTQELALPLSGRLGHPIWRKALSEAGVAPELAEDVVRRISDGYVGWQENSFPGLLGNVVAGRIANRLNLRGTNCVVDAACASSLSALHLAVLELCAGRCDMALTGGVDTLNDIFMYMCFSETTALSPTGDARPFSDEADGTVLGEGIGMLVLKRLADAERDGDRIYAVISAIGTSSDGRSQSIYAPHPGGQARALRNAYRLAGFGPETVGLIEAHGTGTKVGDLAEFEALRTVFREAQSDGRWCALGSVKSQIGHTKAAAGAAGLIKAGLAVYHRSLPPTIKIERPNPKLDVNESPFYLNVGLRPWATRSATPRRAGVSSFGFGGSNFHVVLEEHRAALPEVAWDGSTEILALSADSEEELERLLNEWLAFAEAGDPVGDGANRAALAYKAYLSRQAFSAAHAHRFVAVLNPADDLAATLRGVIGTTRNREGEAPAEPFSLVRESLLAPSQPRPMKPLDLPSVFFGHGAPPGKLAFLFPGQGSQYVGMCRDLACTFPELLTALEQADALGEDAETRLADVIYSTGLLSDEQRQRYAAALTRTEIAQPAIGAISLGLARVLERFGVRPDMAAGHSFGELVALCVAGRFSGETLHRLSRLRGRLMAEGDGDRGTMLAVRAPLAELAGLLERSGLDVVLANRNAPEQGVISGSHEAIGQAFEACRETGWAAKVLTVSGAFHSRLMEAALTPFRHALEAVAFDPARLRVYANVTGDEYPADAAAAREQLSQQLVRTVDWLGEVENLYAAGARVFVEVGPKAVLSGLTGAILGQRPHWAIPLDASAGRQSGVADLARLLAQLAALGYDVDLARWESPAPEPRKPRMVIPLVGANYRAFQSSGPRPRVAELSPQSAASAQLVASPQPVASAPAPVASAQPVASAPRGRRGTRETPPDPQTNPAVATQILRTSPEAELDGTRSMDCIASAIVDESARPQPPTGHTAASEPPIHPAAAETLRVVQEGLLAMQRLSQQTAEAHQRFLSAQEQAHRAIQQLLENQQRLLFGAEAPIAAPSAAPSAARTKPVPVLPSPSERDAPKPAGPRVPADAAVESVVLDVVCQKTGYPREMIELDMDIEADLGVDSIKRVEILAGVEERLPGWSGVRPDYMGSLRTLREIVAYIQAAPGDSRVASLQPTADTVSSDRSVGPPRPTGNTGESPQPANDSRVSSPQAPFAPAAPKPPAGQPDKNAFAETLLSVVSQLTGYPRELLNLDMDMEADLGIDSIKRVEILAAVESKMPGLPPVKPEYMGSLRTLREIAGYFYNEPEASVRASGLPSPAEQLHVEPSEPARLPLTSRSDVNGPRPGPTSDRESRQLESTPPAARISRSALRLVDLPSLSNGTVSIASGCEVWVTDDGAGLSREIVSALTAAGHSARLVAPEPSPADTPPSRIAGLILVAQPTEAVNPLWRTQREQLLKDAFALTKSLAGGFKQAAKQGGALLSTVARMDGAFGLAGGPFDPVQGGLAGLVKTAAREWPGVDCRAIDVSPDWPDSRAAAEAVVRELAGDGPIEVGLSPAGRRGLETLPEQVGSGPLPIGRDDVIVITGGARGVAAEAALALSRACAPKLVLFGRTPQPAEEPAWLAGLNEEAAIKKAIVLHDFAGQPKPSPAKVKAAFNRRMADREIRRNLERIAAAGATVAYHSLDVRDAAAVSAAMNDVRETLGPIRGLIHAAGVLEDRRIEDKTQPQFDAVFDTKVGGLRRLLDAVPLQDLKCLVLFSSVSGRFGNQGQVDYAMANEVLNKAAQRLAAALPSCRVVSINWGPWEGGMVTPALGREFERRGIDLIPLETGGRLLVDELRHGGGRAVEVLIGADTALNAHQGLQRKSGAGPHAARDAEFDSFSLAFERTLDADRHSFMLSHVLDGRPVLPAAVMLEWMAHAALHPNPGLILHGFDDFRVLKGVVLRDESAPLRFMTAKPRRSGSLVDVAVELRGPATPDAETVHARGAAVLTTELPAAPRFDLPADIAARPYERSPERVYAELLFHGEHFHGIEGVQGMSHGGMIARLRTAWPPARWMRDPLRSNWIADPLILDACFQLAVLWCLEEIGVPSLPSFVGRYRQYCTAFPREGVIAVLQVERSSQHSMTGSITLLDDAGRVAARLEGYECTADASLREAFRRRSVVLAGV